MLEALDIAHDEIKKLFDVQLELQARVGKAKWDVAPSRGRSRASSPRSSTRTAPSSTASRRSTTRRSARTATSAAAQPPSSRSSRGRDAATPSARPRSARAFASLEKDIIRQRIAVDKHRPDGRAADEIRPDHHRGRRHAAHARLRALHPRPDAGAHALDARHHREAQRIDTSASRRRSATSTTTTSRRSRSGRPASCAAPSAATSATARSPSGRCCR